MKRLLIILLIFAGFAVFVYPQGEIDEQQKSFSVMRGHSVYFSIPMGMESVTGLQKGLIILTKEYLNSMEAISRTPRNTGKGIRMYREALSFSENSIQLFISGEDIGRQHELYSKEDFGGIAIRYFYSAGPVFGLYKPIYYKVLYPVPGGINEYEVRDEKYDPNQIASPIDIYGRSSFTKGLKEIKAMPGLYGKFGFNFEYSKEDRAIHAIEVGGQVNGFLNEIPIMAITDNKQIFFSLFVSYRFGMILDPLNPETNSFVNIFRRNKTQ
jgi:hypothetical protein